jgi:hypothetical protein
MHQPAFAVGISVRDFDRNAVAIDLQLPDGHIRPDRRRQKKKQEYYARTHWLVEELKEELNLNPVVDRSFNRSVP